MQHSFLGLVFNITVLILEYKRAALAQAFSLGYKPIRPSYFDPDHPGHFPPQYHHRPQIISEGWLWPADPDLPASTFRTTTRTSTTLRPSTTTTTSTTTVASTTVEIPNRGPDIPNLQEGTVPLYNNNSPEINHWYRPVIITNGMNTGSGSDKSTTTSTTTTETPSTTTLASTTSTTTSTHAPPIPTVPGRPAIQFLPEGDLFTSAPVRKKQVDSITSEAPSTTEPPKFIRSTTATSVTTSPMIVRSPEGNVTLAVADLLPLPIELNKNGSAENINLLLPVLPLKAPKDNDIN